MVIGTHSLIAENVEFSALRIAVVDEQHRFGVIQRGRFNSKVTDLFIDYKNRQLLRHMDNHPLGFSSTRKFYNV